MSEGGAPENEEAGSGSGGKRSSQGGKGAAGSAGTAGKTASGGAAGKAGSGGAPGSSGSAGKAGSSGKAGQAGEAGTGGLAGAGGEANEGGSSGSGDGSGEAGKPPVLDCNALEREAQARLEQAQACRPGLAPPASCTGFVQNECDCPVIVDNPESVEAKQYVEAVTALRKRCAVLCLNLVCPVSVRGECSTSGPGSAHCVAEGLGAEVPATP